MGCALGRRPWEDAATLPPCDRIWGEYFLDAQARLSTDVVRAKQFLKGRLRDCRR